MAEGLRARLSDLDPISRTPYGPAANKGPHQEAGHTTVPDQTATDSVLKPGLPIWGRPHTLFKHDRPDHGLTARTADRAVLYDFRRLLAGIRAILGDT